MNRIKRVSYFFRIVFQLVFIGMPLLLMMAWATLPVSMETFSGALRMSFIPQAYLASGSHGTYILHALNDVERLLGCCVSTIPMSVDLFVVYSLIKLFSLYEQGEIFSIKNVKYIRYIGLGLLVGQLIHPMYEALMGVVLTWNNPPGHGFVSITLDQTNMGMILTAMMVLLVSWVMAEGCQLHEEQQLTI